MMFSWATAPFLTTYKITPATESNLFIFRHLLKPLTPQIFKLGPRTSVT